MTYDQEIVDGVTINRFRGIPLVTVLPDGRVLFNTDGKRSGEIFDTMNKMLYDSGKEIRVVNNHVKNSKGEWTELQDGMVVD